MKKLTQEEKEAYSVVQRIRGITGAKKAGSKEMARRGRNGAKKRWANYRKKLSTTKKK